MNNRITTYELIIKPRNQQNDQCSISHLASGTLWTQHQGLSAYFSTYFGWIDITFCTDFLFAQRMYPSDFGDPHFTSSSTKSRFSSYQVKYLNIYKWFAPNAVLTKRIDDTSHQLPDGQAWSFYKNKTWQQNICFLTKNMWNYIHLSLSSVFCGQCQI